MIQNLEKINMIKRNKETIIRNNPELEKERNRIFRVLHEHPNESVVCPCCHNKPKVIVESNNMEHFQIWCPCGFLNLLEKDI